MSETIDSQEIQLSGRFDPVATSTKVDTIESVETGVLCVPER